MEHYPGFPGWVLSATVVFLCGRDRGVLPAEEEEGQVGMEAAGREGVWP